MLKTGCLLALVGLFGIGALGEELVYSRREGGVVFKGVQVFNVSDLVREADGRFAFRRAPIGVHAAFGKQGQAMNEGTTGVEFRFVLKGDSVKLRLGMPADDSHARFTVYHGDMIGDWPELNKSAHGKDSEIVIRQVGNLAGLKAAAKARGDRFDPEVVRLVMSGPVGLRDVIGAVEPPPEAMLPKRTYVAYGSSITHGSNALSIEECYASLVGKGLGADVRNLGFAGSAALEKEVADFIAGERFDFATLEMGINILGMKPEEFERRVRYFVHRIATSHPQAKVLAIDVFGNRMGRQGRAQAAAFRAIVKRVVGELALANVTYVNGLEILPDDIELCSGGVHPTPAGHAIIAKGLIAKFGR